MVELTLDVGDSTGPYEDMSWEPRLSLSVSIACAKGLRHGTLVNVTCEGSSSGSCEGKLFSAPASVLARVRVVGSPSRQPGSVPSAPVRHSADGTLAWSGFSHGKLHFLEGNAGGATAYKSSEGTHRRRCIVVAAPSTVESWGAVRVTVKRGDALHGLMPKSAAMTSSDHDAHQNSEDTNLEPGISRKRNARQPCAVPASWVVASLQGKCLPATCCLVLAPGVVADVCCEVAFSNYGSSPSSLTTTNTSPLVGSETAWGTVLSSANVVVTEQATRWSTSADVTLTPDSDTDNDSRIITATKEKELLDNGSINLYQTGNMAPVSARLSASHRIVATPGVHLGAGELHLERILMRALAPLKSAARERAKEGMTEDVTTALVSASTTEVVTLESTAATPLALATPSAPTLPSSLSLPRESPSMTALLPALVLVPCATSTAAEAAATNIFAVLQNINAQHRRGENAKVNNNKDRVDLWVEVFDPSLTFLEVSQASSGSGRPGVGSGGADCELGPPFKDALDRCFHAAACGQPAVLIVPRDADLVFPDTALAPDADGTVDRAAALQLGAARRKLLLGGNGGSGSFAAQVAVIAITSRRAEVSPEALRCFSHELTNLPTPNPRPARLRSLTKHVTKFLFSSNSIDASDAATTPVPSTMNAGTADPTVTKTKTPHGNLSLLPPSEFRAIIETEASANSTGNASFSGAEPVCLPLAELLALPQCSGAHLEQVARLAALQITGIINESTFWRSSVDTPLNSSAPLSKPAVDYMDTNHTTASNSAKFSQLKCALGPALQWAAAVVSQREPILSGSSTASSRNFRSANKSDEGDNSGANESTRDEEATTAAAATTAPASHLAGAPSAGLPNEGTPSPEETPRSEAPAKGWNSVVGLNSAKAALVESLEWPTKHRRLLQHFLGLKGGAAFSGGSVLLYGPPGTGKTTLGRACAKATGATLIELRATDVVHGTVGTSERALEASFETARRIANHPLKTCFLFIDEFQSIFGSRQPGGATSGLASLLLQLMDAASRAQAPNALLEKDHNNESANNSANHGSSGGGGGRGGRVVVVAATNSPEAIDSAFLRPGRFDHLVYCPPPTAVDRAVAFEQQRHSLPWGGLPFAHPGLGNKDTAAAGAALPDLSTPLPMPSLAPTSALRPLPAALAIAAAPAPAGLAEPPEVSWLVAQTEGYTVADLGHLGRAALYAAAARRRCERQQERHQLKASTTNGHVPLKEAADKIKLTVLRCDYEIALAKVQPSVPSHVRHRYEAWRPPS